MKRLMGAIFILLIFILSVPSVSAAPPNPFTDTPTCGYAEIAPTCCATSNQSDSVSEIIDKYTYVGGGTMVRGLVDQANGLIQENVNQYVSPQCYIGDPSVDPNDSTKCTCQYEVVPTTSQKNSKICERYIVGTDAATLQELSRCRDCADRQGGFYSALGCIPTQISNFISNFVLQVGIGIAGGVALLCIIYSSFILQTAGMNADRVKQAQDQITACITGLLLVIFSVFLLRVIGVDILRIPGFSFR